MGLVEQPRLLQGIPPVDRRAAAGGKDVAGLSVIRGRLAVSPLPCPAEEGDAVARIVHPGPVPGLQHSGRDREQAGVGFQRADQRLHEIRKHFRVIVEKDHIRRRARTDAGIHSSGKPQVLLLLQHRHLTGFQPLGASVGGSVLHHQNVKAGHSLLPQSFDTLRQIFHPVVVRNDNGRFYHKLLLQKYFSIPGMWYGSPIFSLSRSRRAKFDFRRVRFGL